MRVDDGVVAPPPVLRVVSVTVMVPPAPAAVGAERLETPRSGPMRSVRLDRLLPSDDSATTLSASASANSVYVPVASPAGRVAETEPLLDAPAASAGTARLASAV